MNQAITAAPVVSREIDLNNAQLALIKRTLASDTNDDEFNLYIEVARRLKADPFRKHIYALVFNKNDAEKRRLSIVTGIDFYRTVAARNRDYRPDDQPAEVVFDEKLKGPANPQGISHAIVRAYKLGADMKWYPSVGVAYWNEYVPLEETSEDGWDWVETGEKWADSGKPKKKRVPRGEVTERPKGKWREMERTMICKCAEAQALRKGWPEDLSGTYIDEELDRAKATELSATEAIEKADEERRLKLAGASNSVMIMWAPGEPLESVPVGQMADRALAWLRTARTAGDVQAWQDTNRAPLREFWARSKSDGLAVSAACDARKKELAA